MSEVLRSWMGTGFYKNVTLVEYKYSDGSIHYCFRDRLGHPANPTTEEAKKIVKTWGLVEK